MGWGLKVVQSLQQKCCKYRAFPVLTFPEGLGHMGRNTKPMPFNDEPLKNTNRHVELAPLIISSCYSGADDRQHLTSSDKCCLTLSTNTFASSFSTKEIESADCNKHVQPRVCTDENALRNNAYTLKLCCPRFITWRGLHDVLCGSKLCTLLVMVPLTLLAVHLQLGRAWIFVSSLLAIAPLAERLGFVTEQLAFFTGPTVGGLLNATFGNATEMIISILALRQNMIRVVQLSLLGSILSNMLLVLGCAFFFGGWSYPKKDQKFNKAAALVSASLLLMAVMGLLFPAVLHSTHTEIHDGSSELTLSRFSSVVMLIAYASYLYFQLKSHRELYDDVDEGHGESEEASEEEPVLSFWGSIFWLTVLTICISFLSECLVNAIEFSSLIWVASAPYAVLCWGLIIVFSWNMELFSAAFFGVLWSLLIKEQRVSLHLVIMGASEMLNVPVAFISVVILPIVGNAAEHASAIMFALKDKLDISLGVAIGSSTQIAMFVVRFLCACLPCCFRAYCEESDVVSREVVYLPAKSFFICSTVCMLVWAVMPRALLIPFCVVAGWIMGKDMDLDFKVFETATLFITVLVVAYMVQEGTANYFKGLMLVLCYLIVAASFFVHVDNNEDPYSPRGNRG